MFSQRERGREVCRNVTIEGISNILSSGLVCLSACYILLCALLFEGLHACLSVFLSVFLTPTPLPDWAIPVPVLLKPSKANTLCFLWELGSRDVSLSEAQIQEETIWEEWSTEERRKENMRGLEWRGVEEKSTDDRRAEERGAEERKAEESRGEERRDIVASAVMLRASGWGIKKIFKSYFEKVA